MEELNPRRNQDMILAPNEYALIIDETKGEVAVYVGPNKASLAGSDRPSVFDQKTNRFKGVSLEAATQAFLTAVEGSYIVLENPADGDKHPAGTGKLTTPALRTGKKVNISGPASFALWPGQAAKVLAGHNLRSNEFVLARVYDEEAAKANWSKAVIKTQGQGPGLALDPERMQELADLKEPKSKKADAPVVAPNHAAGAFMTEADLSMGKLFVIKGTEVSFYIPPTGIEVVPEHVNGEDRYVRSAVTLERLEYCLLLDQNGNKRYVRGPAVVFPRPTENFVEAPIKSNPEKAKAKKFRAQELTPTSGIHIRVIADYVDELTGRAYKTGEELFVTGKETPVYFPREEHAIIKYGEQDVHYGIAIPAGESRYVLNRETGVISLVRGPQIFLADPRTQVIAQRALPLNLVELLYPGNNEALEINAQRLGIEDQDFMGAGGANAAFLNSTYTRNAAEDEAYGARRGFVATIKGSSKSLPGESFDRKAKFTAPRSVILNTKYDGAVQTTLWTNYAMLLVSKSGTRRVCQGPATFMLEYDESPQVLTLSTGKPKNMDRPLKTVFLKTTANMVSDIVEVETKDFCRLNVKLSYRVNFEGDSSRWFNVDNYVKFLCDHMRSRIRNAAQKIGIEEFYGSHTEFLRNVILGPSPAKGEARPGTAFEENGMRIYDVEVLGVEMQNPEVEKMLVAAQRDVIQSTLVLASERRKLDFTKQTEDLKRQTALAQAETQQATMQLQADNVKRKAALDLAIIQANAQTQAEQTAREAEAVRSRAAITLEQEQSRIEVQKAQAAQNEAERQATLEHSKKQQDLELAKLAAQVQAHVEKSKAIAPGLIEALQAFGDKDLTARVAEAMAPMALIGGESVYDVLSKLLANTPLAKHLPTGKANGAADAHGTATRSARS